MDWDPGYFLRNGVQSTQEFNDRGVVFQFFLFLSDSKTESESVYMIKFSWLLLVIMLSARSTTEASALKMKLFLQLTYLKKLCKLVYYCPWSYL